jgi:F-type H+-transporting ATPase subunit gamma
MALKAIKNKIRSVDRTRKVTKAMEAVSAVKMRTSQQRALSGRPYARAAIAVLSRLSKAAGALRHSLTQVRPVERALFIVITSDKGLAGSLNAAVLREAQKKIDGIALAKENIRVITLGRKAKEYFEKRGYEVVASYENVSDTVSVEAVGDIAAVAMREFESGKADYVDMVYTNFYSTFEQRATSASLLPLSVESVKELVDGIVPERGRYADTAPIVDDVNGAPFYTIEPNEQAVLATLMPQLVSIALYYALNESKASEHSARMVAMKNASDKSLDMSKALTRRYNRERQAAITSEVSEIVGGIEAMATN